jgi:biopolymer transport protein ExbD
MHRWEQTESRRARIEIIPMIDVMMFLLVFFVLLSINVIPALGLKTALPSSSAAKELQIQHLAHVTLAVNGTIQLEGKGVALDQLPPQLRSMQQQYSAKQLVIIVNADQALAFQKIVDLMDVLKGNGFDAISFVTKRK